MSLLQPSKRQRTGTSSFLDTGEESEDSEFELGGGTDPFGEPEEEEDDDDDEDGKEEEKATEKVAETHAPMEATSATSSSSTEDQAQSTGKLDRLPAPKKLDRLPPPKSARRSRKPGYSSSVDYSGNSNLDLPASYFAASSSSNPIQKQNPTSARQAAAQTAFRQHTASTQAHAQYNAPAVASKKEAPGSEDDYSDSSDSSDDEYKAPSTRGPRDEYYGKLSLRGVMGFQAEVPQPPPAPNMLMSNQQPPGGMPFNSQQLQQLQQQQQNPQFQLQQHAQNPPQQPNTQQQLSPQTSIEEEVKDTLIGTLSTEVVALQMFKNVVSINETVRIRAFPVKSDAQAVLVERDGDSGEHIGFLKREAAHALFDLLSQGVVRFEVTIRHVNDDHTKALVRIELSGREEVRRYIEDNLIRSTVLNYTSTKKRSVLADGGLGGVAGDEAYAGFDNVSLEDVESDVDKLFSQQASFDNLAIREPHSSVITKLYDFQKQAYAWMLARENDLTGGALESLQSASNTQFRPHRGGILADDMGLGKTLEMITLIASTSTSAGFDPDDEWTATTLLVCPLSVITNWQMQIRTHIKLGKLSVCTFHGAERHNLDQLDNYDVVITTYTTMANEYKKWVAADGAKGSSMIYEMAWRRVVLDEAHVIRSFATLQSKAACGLNSERRWCLTGTPIQNRIGDFFALLVFLRVQPFVNHTLWNRLIMKPIKNGDSKGLIMLQTVLGAVCLRRKKTDKINGKPILPTLPKKKLCVEKVDYLPTEEALYKKLMDDGRNQVERKKAGNNQSFQFVFFLEILLRMRQTCDHAHMVPESYFEKGGDEPNRVRLQRLLNEGSEDCSLCESEGQKTIEAATRATVCCNSLYCERCLENCDACPGCQAPLRGVLKPGKLEQQTEKKSKKSFKASGKLKFLCDKLREYEKADPTYKIIVFSQWTTFLDLIARTLNNECEDQDIRINHVRLDGSQSHAQRQKSISAFQDDPDVRCFLISLNAGGVGLNLTSGNKVILMDPWWNPATEDQAIDRVHRMGQKRDVEITRLVMRNSLEEKILELQNKKRDMTTTVLAGKFRKKSREQMKEERIEDMMKLLR